MTLKQLRKLKGLTLQETGELIGYAVPYIWNVENSKRSPSIEFMNALAKAYDVDILDIFSILCDQKNIEHKENIIRIEDL